MTYRRGMLSDFFEGIAVKKLTLVETIGPRSNQHEIQGTKPLRRMFGDDDRKSIPTRFIWLNDENEGLSEDGFISWSNVRKGKPRAAEYHLYYSGNIVTGAMKPGDTLFLALRRDGSAMVVVVPLDSTIQSQLLWLFGIDEQPELAFAFKEITGDDSARLDFAARYVLDELGIDFEEPEVDAIDPLIARFGTTFPPTREFSAFARQTLRDVSARDDPDAALFAWMEREELLFRRLERHIIAGQLTGVTGNALVEGVLSLSMQLHQRRRSRAGRALENHLEAVLEAHGVRYARGAETENRNRPDFLFPGTIEYADATFPADRLTMLGVKFTLKDRWRQVLAEANRISGKHLLTFEPGISGQQTSQIAASRLQLVIPRPIHSTFTPAQQAELMDVRDFLGLVRARQAG
ncbi:type II restriction endonuclease [Bradyrhizobium sp. USDA 4506]